MTALRESFVTRFGEYNAAALERAAEGHRPHLLDGDEHGDDPFADALAVCIGFECMSRFADSHGFSLDVEDVKAWAVEVGALNRHVGPVDYLALLSGGYDGWVSEEVAREDA